MSNYCKECLDRQNRIEELEAENAELKRQINRLTDEYIGFCRNISGDRGVLKAKVAELEKRSSECWNKMEN